jgi:hypothetical protein
MHLAIGCRIGGTASHPVPECEVTCMMRKHNRAGGCWDESTFWYLLAVEVARARRAERSFLVLLADVREDAGSMDGRAGRTVDLAAALAGCVRETDLVGWHRTDRRAGALLTETAPEPEVARLVGTKVLQSLGARLPSQVARRLRVRVYRYGPRGGCRRLFPTPRVGEALAPVEPDTAAVAVQPRSSDGTPPAERAEARRTPGEASPAPRLAKRVV